MGRPDRPIPTPIRLRLQRFVQVVGPPVVFLICLAATGWLWSRETTFVSMTGRVEVTDVRVSLSAERGGHLIDILTDPVELFQRVEKGQPLFRVDDRPLLGELAVLQAELARQRLDITARRVALERDEAEGAESRALTRERLFIEVDERRLDVLDRRASLAADRIDVERLTFEAERLERLTDVAAETEFASRVSILRRDALLSRVAEDEKALERAEERLADLLQRLSELPAAPEPLGEDDVLATLLSPAHAELDVLERRMDVVRAAMSMLEIRAPISGVISAINRRVGETVLPGEPIVTITDPAAMHVIAYLPEPGRMDVDVDRPVQLRPLGGGGAAFTGRIVAIGPSVEAIPPEFARDPSAADRTGWGLAVRIELPADTPLRPGQRVDVRLGPA